MGRLEKFELRMGLELRCKITGQGRCISAPFLLTLLFT